jgi:osmoprotectant transport system ATP-binding protein
MRIINRMIEPDSGTVTVNGRNVMDVDPVTLRRHIGYVIQQIGLFPTGRSPTISPRCRSSAGTRKIAARVDELLALVGMDPAIYRSRFPRELSGGQKQRIGVARALAADPPVMLMDEPFGAIDPITRTHLQDEFLRILHALRKTIVFVTHDIDEAIRMGDRIAILKEGALVQFDTPEAILAAPADAFVEAFVGADRALKRLALIPASDAIEPGAPILPESPGIDGASNLRDALARMLSLGVEALVVSGPQGKAIGVVTLAAIRAHTRTARPPEH